MASVVGEPQTTVMPEPVASAAIAPVAEASRRPEIPHEAQWLVVIWSVVLLYSAAHFLYSAVYYAWNAAGGDLLSTFPGPLMFRATQIWPFLAKDWIVPKTLWNYGPVLHFATFPFLLAATQAQAMRLILFCDYGLVAATFVLWMRLLFPGRYRVLAWVGAACIWLNHFPLLEAITGREIEILEFFFVTVGIWSLRRQREVAAGLAFGLATMTKFLPAVFIPYLFVKGYRKGGWVAVLTILVITGLAQMLLGLEHSYTYVVFTEERTGVFLPTAYANQALMNVLYKIFTIFNINEPRPATLYPDLLRPIGLALHLAVFLATSWFIVRWRRSQLIELECALLVIVMFLVAPHANTYYLVFVLPALSLGFVALSNRPQAMGALLKVAFVGAVVFSGFLVPMKAFEVITHVPAVLVARVLQGWSLPGFGAMLAALLMVGLHRIARDQHT